MTRMHLRRLRPHEIASLAPLVDESSAEGFGFVARLVREHDAGITRFDGPGELLLVVEADGEVIAVGGVTRDPHVDDARVGRIRHVYVRAAWRRRGAGRLLVRALESHARAHFAVLRLRTSTPEGAR